DFQFPRKNKANLFKIRQAISVYANEGIDAWKLFEEMVYACLGWAAGDAGIWYTIYLLSYYSTDEMQPSNFICMAAFSFFLIWLYVGLLYGAKEIKFILEYLHEFSLSFNTLFLMSLAYFIAHIL
ncbi:hypothetical protein ACJX0J_010764, partial [Zea mays]